MAFAALVMNAAKADPEPFLVSQPDGTTIEVWAHGDEYFHYLTSRDGVLLFSEDGVLFVAEVNRDASLKSSGVLAHEPAQRGELESKLAKAQPKALFAKAEERMRKKQMEITFESCAFPHIGSPKVLVVLVEFQDCSFVLENPREVFDNFFNAETLDPELADSTLALNYCSVREYFREMSFGKYTPQFDVIGPILLPDNVSTNYGVGRNDRMKELTSDALPMIDKMVNLSDYDQDGDGVIDAICFIAAGYNASQNSSLSNTLIWPKVSDLNLRVNDKLRTGLVCVVCELNGKIGKYPSPHVVGIGLMCHEFSHMLGLPDLYSTSSRAQKLNQTYEYWDLMDAGNYSNNNLNPKAYSPWEREVMGWMDIETLDKPSDIRLVPIGEPGGKAYRIFPEADNPTHYYVLENVQQRGIDEFAFGHGMLIHDIKWEYGSMSKSLPPNNLYEYDDSSGKTSLYSNTRMTLVPADGFVNISYMLGQTIYDENGEPVEYSVNDYREGLAGDPYPGSKMQREPLPLLKDIYYDGPEGLYFYCTKKGYMGPPITDIQEEMDGTVSFRFDGGATPVPMLEQQATFQTPWTLYGTPASKGYRGIKIQHGRKTLGR